MTGSVLLRAVGPCGREATVGPGHAVGVGSMAPGLPAGPSRECGALPRQRCSAGKQCPQGHVIAEAAECPPAQHSLFVPLPTRALLFFLADPPSWVVLLFPTFLPPKGFRALLGGFPMAVWPNPSQLYPPFWKQTWQTPEHARKEFSTRNGLSLHQGTGATLSGPQCCRSLWSCLPDAGGSSLSLVYPPPPFSTCDHGPSSHHAPLQG